MRYLIFLLLFNTTSCNFSSETGFGESSAVEEFEELTPRFAAILDSLGLKGSILLYQPSHHTFYSNDFTWARAGHLPASTFKIPNSIIALETGLVTSKESILPWDGHQRSIENWNQDLSFAKAFTYSCVPCYQQIARDVGHLSMRKYLDRLDYPADLTFDSSTIDLFWLEGESRISQFEQIHFIERLYKNELPVSANTVETIKDIMRMDTTSHYILSGKTGWSITNKANNGWFVGFAEAKNETLYFATNVEPKPETSISDFIAGRRAATEAAIKMVDW